MRINVGPLAGALARARGMGHAGEQEAYERDQQEQARAESALMRQMAMEQQRAQTESLEQWRQGQLENDRLQQQGARTQAAQNMFAKAAEGQAARDARTRRLAALIAKGASVEEAEALADDVVATRERLRPVEAPTPRNIDPLSPEGVQASVARERALAPIRASQRAPADATRLKPVPNAVASAFLGNQKQLSTIDKTIAALEANPDAVGAKALVPDMILNRLPGKGGREGVEARAGVGDVGSLLIHDRTGATMAVSEALRLKPFVPSPTDDSQTALKKLRRLREAVAEENASMADFYTPDQGYRGIGPTPPAAAGPSMPPAKPHGAPSTAAPVDPDEAWAADYLRRKRGGG